jgi:hypothetical protein
MSNFEFEFECLKNIVPVTIAGTAVEMQIDGKVVKAQSPDDALAIWASAYAPDGAHCAVCGHETYAIPSLYVENKGFYCHECI